MNNPSLELSILMPCLNEELTLGTCINKAQKYLQQNSIKGEVLIADNGSTDNSITLAESLGARVVRISEKGYGNALHGGIQAAHGKYVIMGDSDDSYDFSNLSLYMEELRKGNDIVVGNRFKGGIDQGAMPFLHKYLGNPVLSFIGKLFFKIPLNDFHCGLRGVNRERILSIGLNTTGMEFASEMIVKSALSGLSMKEVPTTLKKDGRNRKPHLNTWRDGWRHLRFLLIYSPRWLFLFPGMLLTFVGLLLAITLTITPIKVFSLRLDIHTLLYASFMVISGVQMIYFYFFSKLYGYLHNLFPGSENPKMVNYLSLESGVILGGVLFLAGIILSIISFQIWRSNDFGDLIPSHMFRIVIPAVTFLLLGIQFIQNSFFLSVIRLQSRK